MSNTKASSVRTKLLLQSGNLIRLTLWWVTADRWLRATSTPSSKSLIYKKEKKTRSLLIMWHRYAKRTIRWLCPSNSRCKEVWITIQDAPPESRRQTHLLHITYSYCILSRVWKLATSLLVLRHYEHLFLFSMLILHVTSSRFCWYLLNIYYFTYTFSHTHTSTHVQSAHRRNGDNQAQEPGWEGQKKGYVRDLAHAKKIKSEKTWYSRI